STSCLRCRREFRFYGRVRAFDSATPFIRRAPRNKLVFELVHKAQHRPGAGFAEGADGPSLDVLCDMDQIIRVLLAPEPVREAMQRLAHPERTFAAGSALAAALVRVELGDVCQRLD